MNVWKTIKLFISSTFIDLELERDSLTEEFSNIKKELVERQLSFMTYDLRWRQKHERDSIVKWCLEMVDRCEYFVGILGSRYGWRPPTDIDGNPNKNNISVTEMEIDHALKTIEKDKRFFCILQRSAENSEDAASLRQLRKKLIENGEDIYEFSDTKEMLHYVISKIRSKINQHYPIKERVNIEQQTSEEIMEELIDEKVMGFVGRDAFLDKIEKFAQDDSEKNYLIIHAMAGSGKSAVNAQFYRNWQKNSDIPILRYFITLDSSLRDLNKSLAQQMVEKGILIEEIKDDPFELRTQIRSTLENIKAPVILLIDAIDEIEESAQDLLWLPRTFPKNIRIIISTRPVSTFDILKKYPKIFILSLPPLDNDGIQKIIEHYVKKHGIAIPSQDRQLLQERADGNPLYLKVALEEVISTGVGIGQLATSIDSLFEQILERLHNKYNTYLIFDYLGFIAASRTGLSENEIREVLVAYSDTEDISDDLLLIVSKSLAHFIVYRAGVIQFFHAEFERSIKQRLGRNRMRKYHKNLAFYFQECGYSYARSLSEICYQMQWAEMNEDLLILLANIDFLESKAQHGMIDDLVYDLDSALFHPLLPIPENTQTSNYNIKINRPVLQLIWKSLSLDLRFLRQHPDKIFQCLWNRGYWYNSQNAKNYYVYQENEGLPWKNKNCLFSELVCAWKQQPSSKRKTTWLETLAPLEPHLDSRLRKLFSGHQREILSVALHQEKQRIISVSRDRKIYVWHMETGECLLEIKDHKEHVYSVAFQPDGRKFATGDSNGFIFVWDTNNGECLQIFEGHQGIVTSLKFWENNILVSTSEDASIIFWDVQSGQKMYALEEHQDGVYSVDFSHDKKWMASASKDGYIYIWEVANRTCIAKIKAHERVINDVSFSFDNHYLASCAKDNNIRIWEMSTKKCLCTLENHYDSINSIHFLPDTHIIISGGEDGSICLTDIHSKDVVLGWQSYNWHINSLAISSDGDYVVCGAKDGSLSLWDIKNYKTTSHNIYKNATLNLKGHKANISQIAVCASHKIVVSGAKDKFIKVWDINTNETIRNIFTEDCEIHSLNLSSDGTKVVIGAANGTIGIWNIQTGDCIHHIKGHKGIVSKVRFCHGDRDFISVGYFDNIIRLWETASGQLKQTFEGHERWIESFAINNEQTLIASGSRDRTMKVWNIETGECLRTMYRHELGVTSIAFSNDSSKIASASGNREGVVRIWQTDNASCLFVLSKHLDFIDEMKFSEDDTQIASVCRANETRIWNVHTGDLIESIEGQVLLQDYYNSKCTQYPLMQSWQTVLIDKKTQQTVVAFPEAIFSPCVMDNYLIGLCKSNNRGITMLQIRTV